MKTLLYILIFILLSSCCVCYDIQYSIENWKIDDIQEVYYVPVQEVYKPAKMKPIVKSDSIRYIGK